MVQETSLEAYRSIQSDLGEKQAEVLEIFLGMPKALLSNLDVAKRLRWSINRVCPRMKELREKGLLVHDGYQTQPETKRRVMLWRLRMMPQTKKAWFTK